MKASVAKGVLESKLLAAYKRIRELELQIVSFEGTGTETSASEDETLAIHREVNSRLDMARPTLTSLVTAGRSGAKTNIPGAMRATRNFALHAELGCGKQALPTCGAEAKRRIRGGSKLSDKPSTETDVSFPAASYHDQCTRTHPSELLQFEIIDARLSRLEASIGISFDGEQLIAQASNSGIAYAVNTHIDDSGARPSATDVFSAQQQDCDIDCTFSGRFANALQMFDTSCS